MQETIHKFNQVVNSNTHSSEEKEFAKGMSKFLWSFDKLHRVNQKLNKKAMEMIKNGKYK